MKKPQQENLDFTIHSLLMTLESLQHVIQNLETRLHDVENELYWHKEAQKRPQEP